MGRLISAMPRDVTARERLLRDRRQLTEDEPGPPLAALLSLLLVVFLVFSLLVLAERLQINPALTLPAATHAAARGGSSQVIVNLTELGGIEIDEFAYAKPGETIPRLQQAAAAGAWTRLLVRADRDARYESVRAVMKAAVQAGLQQAAFAVRGEHGEENEYRFAMPSAAAAGLAAAGPPPATIVLDIAADGQVTMNGTPFGAPADRSLAALRDWLRETLHDFGDQDLMIIHPAPETRYGRIVEVLEAAAASGVKNLSFG